MRINGVLAIMQHLGYKSRAKWKRLRAAGMPFYRDPDDQTLVWAFTEELDEWARQRGIKDSNGGVPEAPVKYHIPTR